MNSTTLRLLGIVVALLVIALIVIESGGDGTSSESGAKLLPELREELSDVDSLRVERSDQDPVVIARRDDRWVVESRDGYSADVGKVREALLAMADATSIEAKTASSELHGRLGLEMPDVENSKGTLLVVGVGDQDYRLLLGNVAQTSYRYARLPDQDQTWLIDQNPDLPTAAGDWLDAAIIDIDSATVRAVTITHPDGEVISIEKVGEDDDFTVNDIPEGRELSYTTVANGIGGALNALELDDVRQAEGDADAIVTSFETFDGMTVTVDTTRSGEGSWISLEATGAGADELNTTLAGWQFKVADYKANLLTRRWEDILEPEADDEPEE
jgi:hypothetical protein